jgi:hypothetical protein
MFLNRPHQQIMVNRVKEGPDIQVQHPVKAPAILPRTCDSIFGASTRSITKRIRMEYLLEPRFQDHFDRHLSSPVSDSRYSQGAWTTVTFRNHNLSYRFRVITSGAHSVPLFIEISAQLVLKYIDAFHINTWCAVVGCHAFPCIPD